MKVTKTLSLVLLFLVLPDTSLGSSAHTPIPLNASLAAIIGDYDSSFEDSTSGAAANLDESATVQEPQAEAATGADLPDPVPAVASEAPEDPGATTDTTVLVGGHSTRTLGILAKLEAFRKKSEKSKTESEKGDGKPENRKDPEKRQRPPSWSSLPSPRPRKRRRRESFSDTSSDLEDGELHEDAGSDSEIQSDSEEGELHPQTVRTDTGRLHGKRKRKLGSKRRKSSKDIRLREPAYEIEEGELRPSISVSPEYIKSWYKHWWML